LGVKGAFSLNMKGDYRMRRYAHRWMLTALVCAVLNIGNIAYSENYICTESNPNQKCLTVNAKNFWIVGEIRSFAFGGDAKSRIMQEMRSNGWLECEGQSLDSTDFQELYRAIGPTWGSRDPQQSFLVPDLRGIFLRGWNHARSQQNPDGSDRAPQFPDPGDHRTTPRTQQDVGKGGAPGNSGDGVGSMQPNAVVTHTHNLGKYRDHTIKAIPGDGTPVPMDFASAPIINTSAPSSGEFPETRPNNVYVIYFIYVGPYDLTKVQIDSKTGNFMMPH
jgi:hypothetical protein